MRIDVFCELFKKKNNLGDVHNLNDIIFFFKKLKTQIENKEISALLIAHYLYKNISSQNVRKRKSSATEFEDFLDFALKGKVTDREARKNILGELIYQKKILNYVSSNRREKMDIIFPSNYGLSLKTSIPENSEINLGSFAREALFDGFLSSSEYGGERKGGLGSKPQVKVTLEKISIKGKWKEFCERFSFMVENIFVDDLLFVVKDDKKMQIYAIKGKDLREVLINSVNGGPSNAVTVINRYEGNSIRVDRSKIINRGTKIDLDFTSLETSNVSRVLDLLAQFEHEILLVFEKNDEINCETLFTTALKEVLLLFKK